VSAVPAVCADHPETVRIVHTAWKDRIEHSDRPIITRVPEEKPDLEKQTKHELQHLRRHKKHRRG
jgi:hypothetical protein